LITTKRPKRARGPREKTGARGKKEKLCDKKKESPNRGSEGKDSEASLGVTKGGDPPLSLGKGGEK